MLELSRVARSLFRCFEVELFLRTDCDVEHLMILRKTPPDAAA